MATFIVTPKSSAEINQLVSLFDRAGYPQADKDFGERLQIDQPVTVFAFHWCEWWAKASEQLVDNSEHLTVNELGTLLTRG